MQITGSTRVATRQARARVRGRLLARSFLKANTKTNPEPPDGRGGHFSGATGPLSERPLPHAASIGRGLTCDVGERSGRPGRLGQEVEPHVPVFVDRRKRLVHVASRVGIAVDGELRQDQPPNRAGQDGMLAQRVPDVARPEHEGALPRQARSLGIGAEHRSPRTSVPTEASG